VKAVAGEVPVEGRIVFTRNGKFPKGPCPKWTLMIDSLRSEFPPVERVALASTIERFDEAWKQLKRRVPAECDESAAAVLVYRKKIASDFFRYRAFVPPAPKKNVVFCRLALSRSYARAGCFRVVGQHERHADRELFRVRQMQEFIGPVRIRLRPPARRSRRTACSGKTRSEHAEEGNRAPRYRRGRRHDRIPASRPRRSIPRATARRAARSTRGCPHP